MRRFASWTTSHRKTVIVGWIVALIGDRDHRRAPSGSDFSEEFSLPSSDSKDALDLLENRFPAQAGDTVQIVYKAESGVEAPAVKQKMEGVFAKVDGAAPRQRSRQPLRKGRRRRGQRRRQDRLRDRPVQRHHRQAERRRSQEDHGHRAGGRRRRAAGRGRRLAGRGSPRRRRRRLLGGDRRPRRDRGPADQLRLGRRDGAADPDRAVRARRRDQRHHPLHPRLQHRRIRAAAGLHDRARRRGRLRPLHPHPLPQRPRRGARQARGGDRRRRHRRPRGALRRDHGDHLADGDDAARPPLPLRGRDGGGDRGAVHDDRGADPAAGAAGARRQLGQPAAHPVPRQRRPQHRRRQLVVPLERSHPAAAVAGGAALRRPADRPLHPHPLAAARDQRRRHRPGGDDDARSLRPARRRLRTGLQRPLRARRRTAREGRRRGAEAAADRAEGRRRRRSSHRRHPQPERRPSASSRSTRRPRRRARTRPTCSTTSATT